MANIDLARAEEWAALVTFFLIPFCSAVETVGSIRRRSPYNGDIDVACCPLRTHSGVPIPEFVDAVETMPRVRGYATGRLTRRVLDPGVEMDLFIGTERNFGLLVAFRTGSEFYYRRVIKPAIDAKKYSMVEGELIQPDGKIVPVETEQKFFTLLGIPMREPWLRAL